MVTFEGADGETYTIIQLNSATPDVNVHAPSFSYGVNADGEEMIHIFGTDAYGRDVFARLMYGGRISLTISFMTVILIALFGIVMGGLAGYFGKWVDMLIMQHRRRHQLRSDTADTAHIQRHSGRVCADV